PLELLLGRLQQPFAQVELPLPLVEFLPACRQFLQKIHLGAAEGRAGPARVEATGCHLRQFGLQGGSLGGGLRFRLRPRCFFGLFLGDSDREQFRPLLPREGLPDAAELHCQNQAGREDRRRDQMKAGATAHARPLFHALDGLEQGGSPRGRRSGGGSETGSNAGWHCSAGSLEAAGGRAAAGWPRAARSLRSVRVPRALATASCNARPLLSADARSPCMAASAAAVAALNCEIRAVSSPRSRRSMPRRLLSRAA